MWIERSVIKFYVLSLNFAGIRDKWMGPNLEKVGDQHYASKLTLLFLQLTVINKIITVCSY